MVSIGLLATRQSFRIGYEVFPGSTSDVEAFREMLRVLNTRFRIRRVIICADRDMVSDKILKELREDGIEYIVGARPSNAVEDAISYKGANWQPVDEIKIRIKPMGDDGETYIVCHNPTEAKHDHARRQEIVARLRRQVQENPSAKSLLRNSSFKSYVRLGNANVEIDEEKIQKATRYDGKYVLRFNADFTAQEVALAYHQLFRVERAFRELKGPLKLRPVYHFPDRRIRGHIMVCFLAYALEMALRQELAGKKCPIMLTVSKSAFESAHLPTGNAIEQDNGPVATKPAGPLFRRVPPRVLNGRGGDAMHLRDCATAGVAGGFTALHKLSATAAPSF